MKTKRWMITPLLLALLLAASCRQTGGQPALAAPPAPAGNPSQPFRFAVLGDNRGSAAGDVPPVYRTLLRQINASGAAFLLHTGDLILGAGTDAMRERQLDKFFEATAELKIPWYVALGNHDASATAIRRLSAQKLNPDYFAFDYGNSRFYMLNTEIPGHAALIDGAQFAWLADDLQTRGARAAHRFACMHRPLYSPMIDSGKRAWGNAANKAALHRLFVDNRVDAVFAGHDHYYAARTVEGVRYIVTGGGGAPLYQGQGAVVTNHFVLVNVDGDRVDYQMIPAQP